MLPSYMSLFALCLSCCCVGVTMHADLLQQLQDPCGSTRVIRDDWRYPSEENKRKCDGHLRPGLWYKFRYQGQSAIIAQGPIKANHCGTSGPISIFLQSDAHLYPPPIGQSALYRACVHVTVMGVVTCLDHLTIPLLVMTCPDNDVIYFVNRTLQECPSAFCVIGRNETVDRYYLLDALDQKEFFQEKSPDDNSIEVDQLTPLQTEELVSYATDLQDENIESRWEEIKRHIVRALNFKSWSNCAGKNSDKSSNCHDYEKSIIRSSISVLGNLISEDLSNETSDASVVNDDGILEEVRNASGLSYEASMQKFASSLCHVQLEDVKLVKLSPRFAAGVTRSSIYVESFCGITRGYNLMRTLVWLNTTGILGNLSNAGVVSIFRGLPIDQLCTVKVSEFNLSASLWVTLYCCLFVLFSTLLFVYSCFRIQCVTTNHMNQKERYLLISCDGKREWLSGSHKKRGHGRRSRLNTLTSTSRDVLYSQASAVSTRRPSVISRATLTPQTLTPPIQAEQFLKVKGAPRIDNRFPSRQISTISFKIEEENEGPTAPLEETSAKVLFPKLVVDSKRRNLGVAIKLSTPVKRTTNTGNEDL